ncbi:sugar phosphate isomerase/epimerase family protein [Aliivibrio logei]|uniref:Xylose isomerase n=1 Tax=Aliivibrio logei 5S-186 TaxID=626086 RepID=A0ABX3ARU4_ALILO|nr:sugar phosphate isomerase/epimerase [Aliivibrio logei]OEF10158.1 xylose isomerase [Aliivibrio logei 5S-186]
MISISNIAWDVAQDDDVAKVLNDYAVPYIDIAPPKYFDIPSQTEEKQILEIKHYWNSRGIEPIGMQALLFGTTGLNVFGSGKTQDLLLQHLTHICRIGSTLGAKKLVFGSPKNRDRSHLDDTQTLKISVDFFRRLGAIAESYGVVICLEPNPECYQANFMTNSVDTANIVRDVNHANIRMQLDIGAMNINNEDPSKIIKSVAPIIYHIHISEPQLAPLNKDNHYHKKAAEAIQAYLPEIPMTIEMLTSNSNSSIQQIRNAIELIQQVYRKI